METKEDLRDRFATLLKQLFTDPPDAEEVKQYRFMHTSGTTGMPLPVLYTETPDWNPEYLGNGARVLMLSGSKSLRVDFLRSYTDQDTPNSDIMILHVGMPAEKIIQSQKEFEPDVIVGSPSIVLRITRAWDSDACGAIKNIILASELASRAVSEEIHRRFPNATIRNYYPAMETGLMGRQCPQCAWNEFHPLDGVAFRIHEPDADGRGDLLVSKANLGGITVTDYQIGDVASESTHDGMPTITLHGRRGFDYIKVAEALLIREEFDRVAMELERYIEDYRAELTTRIMDGVPKHHLTLQVVLKHGVPETDTELADHLAREVSVRLFITPQSTLADAVEKEIFAPIAVRIVDTIVHTTAKPQRLIHLDQD